jgi:hypothetical protein
MDIDSDLGLDRDLVGVVVSVGGFVILEDILCDVANESKYEVYFARCCTEAVMHWNYDCIQYCDDT